jgi:ABC-type uncharacterized transport system substrate-binding protein
VSIKIVHNADGKIGIFWWVSCALIVTFCSSAQAQKIYRVGYLTLRPAPFEQDQIFKQELRKLGWFEGQNIAIDFRGAAGKVDRLVTLAKELVSLNVDVIVTSSTPSAEAARSTTSTIPIVMAGAADPVGTGFVHSLSHPGGNITGLSLQSPELAGKRMELLVQIIPKLAQVAFLAFGRDPAHRLFIKEAQAAAEELKIQIHPLVIHDLAEIDNAFAKLVRERAGALVIQPLFIGGLGQSKKIVDFAVRNRMPTVSDGTQFADLGGLIYYGPSRLELASRAAALVDKILKGTKPANLPVEQPTKFELIVNLKTAKQIDLIIPPNVLARADRVIK